MHANVCTIKQFMQYNDSIQQLYQLCLIGKRPTQLSIPYTVKHLHFSFSIRTNVSEI